MALGRAHSGAHGWGMRFLKACLYRVEGRVENHLCPKTMEREVLSPEEFPSFSFMHVVLSSRLKLCHYFCYRERLAMSQPAVTTMAPLPIFPCPIEECTFQPSARFLNLALPRPANSRDLFSFPFDPVDVQRIPQTYRRI